jgi:hypothetical protein
MPAEHALRHFEGSFQRPSAPQIAAPLFTQDMAPGMHSPAHPPF